MTDVKTTSESSVSRLFISIPEGRAIAGRVKEIEGVEAYPEDAHPGEPHPWREMLHYGQSGTGFAQCICGAIGVPYCTHAPGRLIPQPIVREFLRALGVLTCADCGQVTAILGRRARVVENPK